jgi:hypothetical protein
LTGRFQIKARELLGFEDKHNWRNYVALP